MKKQNVYTVAQVNSYIRNMFTQDFLLQSLLVKGEVSNLKYHPSGHIYFTLKDEKGAVSCVMFSGSRSGLKFRMEEGQQVVVAGAVDVYERDGRYQLYARQIELSGPGALYERFEQLKRELCERGMFAPEYKQPVPKYVRTLGVVTASTGAAVRDIINIAGRRSPYVQIILYPATVQGDGAAASIVNGIRALELLGVDVMIIGRGGGSIEDLWAFNEEIVAQAVFDCSVPVICAVGHETDTTIADFVADLRAPTPSAAAELAVYDAAALEERLRGYADVLHRRMSGRLEREKSRAAGYALRLRHLGPAGRIREKRMRAARLSDMLSESMNRTLTKNRHLLAIYAERLRGMSPLDKLGQGFSYTADEKGRTVTDIGQVDVGSRILVHVKNGRLEAEVTKKESWNPRDGGSLPC